MESQIINQQINSLTLKQNQNLIKKLDESQFDQPYRIPFNQTQKWKSYLKQEGFVVIKNYLSQQETAQSLDQIWQIIEYISLEKIHRNDIQTQKDKKNYPSSHHNGLIQYIGHSKVQWKLRLRSKPIFQKLWNIQNNSNQQNQQENNKFLKQKLKVSFDGLAFTNGLLKYQQKPEQQSLHVDQPPIKKNLWSYQGIMALSNAGDNGGGFVCVPKSHKYFVEYFKQKGLQNRTISYHVPEEEIYHEPFRNYVKVNVQAGDFIIFDSRTFHSSTTPRNDNLRVVTYICMMPQKLIPPLIQNQRKQTFKRRQNSGHHCGDGFRQFMKWPKKMPKKKEQQEQFQRRVQQINQLENQQLQSNEQILELV